MLTGVAAAVFLFAGLLRIRPAIADPERRPLCLALLCIALGSTFDLDPVAVPFDRAIGVLNASDLLAHCLGIIGVYYLLRALDGLNSSSSGRASRWLRPFLLVAVVSSVALFAATPMPVEAAAFTAEYGRLPTVAAYWAISIAFPTLCLAQLLRTAVSNWSTPDPELRGGLRIVAAGVLLGFVYSAAKLAEVISQVARGPNLALALHFADRLVLGLGLLLVAGGLTVTSPAVTGRLVGLWTWASSAYLDRRLCWLWHLVCVDAAAAAILDTQGGGAKFRLLRKVVETRDGLSNLRSVGGRGLRPTSGGAALVSTRRAVALVHALDAVDEEWGASLAPPRGDTALNARTEARDLVILGGKVRKALKCHDD